MLSAWGGMKKTMICKVWELHNIKLEELLFRS